MPSTTLASPSVACSVIAQSVCRASAEDVVRLRKSPGSFGGQAIAPSLLRHADEQTVVGLVATLEAASRHQAEAGDFADWAVLAAPRFLGRSMFESAFPQFMAEGAWGVSPHLVPAHSLHSASGTISLAIKAHGLNLGIGGALESGSEGLIAAATWLQSGMIQGVWLVLSHRIEDDEHENGIHTRGDYEALAMALIPEHREIPSVRIQIHPDRLQIDPTCGLAADREVLADWLPLVDSDAVAVSIRADAGHPPGSSHFRRGSERLDPVADLRDQS